MAHAESRAPTSLELPLFTIAKSENKNQVQYAVHVDEHCAPSPGAPVFAYWRMFELGPTRVAPLLSRELGAYGFASQLVTTRDATSGTIRLVLRALPSRPIVVETTRGENGLCRALATATVAGSNAHLFNVYVKLSALVGVDYLLLRGWAMDGSRVLAEKLKK